MTDPQTLDVLRATLQVLKDLERNPDSFASLPREQQVEVGYLVSGLAKHAKKALEKTKPSLRSLARSILKDRYGTQALEGTGRARCSVHFPLPIVKLRKGADIRALQRHLGDQFPVFFSATYTPTKDFKEHLAELEDPSVLLDAVDMPESTPRVTFDSE
jgi:hypothetical protein